MHNYTVTIKCEFLEERILPSGDNYYTGDIYYFADSFYADNISIALDMASGYCEDNFPDCNCTIFSIVRNC